MNSEFYESIAQEAFSDELCKLGYDEGGSGGGGMGTGLLMGGMGAAGGYAYARHNAQGAIASAAKKAASGAYRKGLLHGGVAGAGLGAAGTHFGKQYGGQAADVVQNLAGKAGEIGRGIGGKTGRTMSRFASKVVSTIGKFR
jgi:hypothetical protein